MTVKEAAREYYGKGFSIIPLNIDKKPALDTWKPYQEERPSFDLVSKWWHNGSGPGIGIITGKLSGIVVVDVDDVKEGFDNLSKYITPGIITPMVKTPTGGYHLYFKHPGIELINKTGAIPGTDFRGDGGYVVAPPSHCEYEKKGKQISGDYVWVKSFEDAPLADLPPAYISCIKSFSLYARVDSQETKSGKTFFVEGTRDQDIFHLANLLIKGGGEPEFVRQVLEIAAQSCNPPFPEKDVEVKLKSAIERANRKERNLTEEVTEFVMSTSGDFLSTDVHKFLDLSTRVHKKGVSTILSRLVESGLIEKVGNKNGSWRKIDRTFHEQCWWEDDGKPLDLKFPLGIGELAKVYPGNVVLLEGQKSQGKSAFALEFVRLNSPLFSGQKILYQNVEMANSELMERFKSYGDVFTPEQWRRTATFIRQSGEWWDKILPDGLNIVDYLIEYKEAYLIADFVWKIHQKLKSGIALVVVQRDPLKPYPAGGRAVRDIPRLAISLIHHKVKLEDVKSFHYSEYGNPTGLIKKYKQVHWWKFEGVGDWYFEAEEKYADFPKEKNK